MRRRLFQADARLALAVALSLVLHGLLAALALLAPTPAPVTPGVGEVTTIELELVPPPSRPEPAPGAGQRLDGALAAQLQQLQLAPPRARAGAGASHARTGIPVPAGARAAAAGAGETAPTPAAPLPAAPERKRETPPPGFPYRALVLDPPLHHGDGPEEPAPPPPPTRAELEERLAARIDGFVDDKQARDRAGRPDGYWLDVRERLAHRFSPDPDLLATGPSTGLLPGIEKSVQGWLVEAERYGRTGSPWDEDPVTKKPTRDGQGVAEPPASEHGIWLHSMSATVVLLQGEEGEVLSVSLGRSSGNAVYDRQALAAVQSLALEQIELGRPQQGKRTVWSFESELLIVPPAPIAGCSFDATFVPQECFYPLKRLLHSRVRLLEVHAG